MPADIPLSEAMLAWSRGGPVAVIPHPDERGLSDRYEMTAGACWSHWRRSDEKTLKLKLMVEVWHLAAFYDVPPADLHKALLVIPEYRDMLADDCLPTEFQHERD